MNAGRISTFEQVLDLIDQSAADQDRVSLGMILEAVGGRSFGPLLLVAGIILASPLSAIPGMPTTVGSLLLLTAGQLLLRRRHLWLPRWLLRRSIGRERLVKSIAWLRKPARAVDRRVRPRLPGLIQSAGLAVIALLCILIASVLPFMELVPLSAHVAGVAVTAFGLSLIARDGLMALVAMAVTATACGSLIYQLI